MVGWECVLRVVLQQAFIMVVDNLSSIAHAAVADLNGVVVEYFPQFVACWEMLFYQGKEDVSNIVGDIFAIWGIIPKDVVSLSVLFLCWFSWFIE